MKLPPEFVSVTYGAGGSNHNATVDLIKRLHDETTIDIAAHLTLVNSSILDVKNLGSVKINLLNKNNFKDEIIYRRAKHVITENERVIEAKKSIFENTIEKFGKLMNLSHLSYSNDFEASTKDVDLLTKRSLECGALGSRLTGGGFGGFTVSLIQKKDYESWYNKMNKYYSSDKFFKV